MPVLLRKSRNEIHCNLLEGKRAFFGCNTVERYFLSVGHDFVLLTGCAAFYVVCDPLPHPRPWQDFRSFSNCFISSGMSCGGVIMDESHKVSFQGVQYLCGSSVYEEFWFKEGLILVVVVPLVRIGWV